jgi:hypothetical protein
LRIVWTFNYTWMCNSTFVYGMIEKFLDIEFVELLGF